MLHCMHVGCPILSKNVGVVLIIMLIFSLEIRRRLCTQLQESHRIMSSQESGQRAETYITRKIAEKNYQDKIFRSLRGDIKL